MGGAGADFVGVLWGGGARAFFVCFLRRLRINLGISGSRMPSKAQIDLSSPNSTALHCRYGLASVLLALERGC